MQIKSLTSLAAITLTLGAASAQSAPRVLQIDETQATQGAPAAQGVRATSKPAEVRVLRAADGQVLLAPSTTVLGAGQGGGLGSGGQQEAAQQGFLGVQLGGEGEGAPIMGLVDGGPAQQAKLQAGDRVLAVDGQRIASAEELTAAIRGKRPGTVVKLSIARGDDELVQEVTLGTRGGAGAAAVPGAPMARMVTPQQLELRTLDLDDDEADDEDDEDDEQGERGESRKVRFRIGHAPGAGQAPGAGEHRVEVRKEVHQQGDGQPEVKVWVNGEEVDPDTMGGQWLGAEGHGEFELQIEGLEDTIEQHLGGAHTFRFEGAPGHEGQFVIVHPGGKADGRGVMKFEGHALPPMVLQGGGSPELQRRVDELEGQVQRLEQQVREMHEMLRQVRGGDQGDPRAERAPWGQAGESRRRDARANDTAPGPRPPQGVNAAETPSSGFFFESGPGGGPGGGAGGGMGSGPGGAMGSGRAGGNETDDLRREMRELMRAIERLERQGGGGQGGGQDGRQTR